MEVMRRMNESNMEMMLRMNEKSMELFKTLNEASNSREDARLDKLIGVIKTVVESRAA
jgi:hypothetical protein